MAKGKIPPALAAYIAKKAAGKASTKSTVAMKTMKSQKKGKC